MKWLQYKCELKDITTGHTKFSRIYTVSMEAFLLIGSHYGATITPEQIIQRWNRSFRTAPAVLHGYKWVYTLLAKITLKHLNIRV